MTDFELYTLVAKYMELNFILAGLLITVFSGFLVMSFTVGAKLTPRQVKLVVLSYLIFVIPMIYGVIFLRVLANRFVPANWETVGLENISLIDPDNPFAQNHLGLTICILIVIGSLLFLRDIRKNAARTRAKEKRRSLASRARMMRSAGPARAGLAHRRPRKARAGGSN